MVEWTEEMGGAVTRNTTIKNNSDRSGGNDGHGPALVCGGANRGDGRHSTLKVDTGQKRLRKQTLKLTHTR
jgi:hypothetical protein